jgi:hypothetical protein
MFAPGKRANVDIGIFCHMSYSAFPAHTGQSCSVPLPNFAQGRKGVTGIYHRHEKQDSSPRLFLSPVSASANNCAIVIGSHAMSNMRYADMAAPGQTPTQLSPAHRGYADVSGDPYSAPPATFDDSLDLYASIGQADWVSRPQIAFRYLADQQQALFNQTSVEPPFLTHVPTGAPIPPIPTHVSPQATAAALTAPAPTYPLQSLLPPQTISPLQGFPPLQALHDGFPPINAATQAFFGKSLGSHWLGVGLKEVAQVLVLYRRRRLQTLRSRLIYIPRPIGIRRYTHRLHLVHWRPCLRPRTRGSRGLCLCARARRLTTHVCST